MKFLRTWLLKQINRARAESDSIQSAGSTTAGGKSHTDTRFYSDRFTLNVFPANGGVVIELTQPDNSPNSFGSITSQLYVLTGTDNLAESLAKIITVHQLQK